MFFLKIEELSTLQFFNLLHDMIFDHNFIRYQILSYLFQTLRFSVVDVLRISSLYIYCIVWYKQTRCQELVCLTPYDAIPVTSSDVLIQT